MDAHDDRRRMETTHVFVSALLEFIDANRPLLAAFVANRLSAGRTEEADALGLAPFFAISESELRRRHAESGRATDVPVRALARLNLGLVLGTGLLLDLLFPEGRPDHEKLTHALSRMIAATVAADPPIAIL